MKIENIRVRNFRSFEELDLQLDGESIFFIGENACGKTSLLTAIARGLGRDLSFTRADFQDLEEPIELEVMLTDFDAEQRGLFGNFIHFGAPPTLTVGVRAIWDTAAEDADVEHWYPQHAGSRSKREEREGIPLQWLHAGRDPTRMLQFGVPRNVMGLILEGLPIAQSIDQAVDDVRQASEQLGRDAALTQLLSDTRDRFAQLLPEVAQDAFAMGVSALTGRDLLRQFELQVQHLGDPVAVSRQSSGVAQLAVFVFAMQLVATRPGTFLLIDEPEISLHPHSQRALMRFLGTLDAQVIAATHSSNVLDRVDPRAVARMKRDGSGLVTVVRPSGLSDADARRLARHTSPHTAEAFFARAVVLVEGLSDQYALEALAERRGRNLDAEGISIVPLGGAATIGAYLDLFGPNGFDLRVAGLCDEAEEPLFKRALENTGHVINSRADMEQVGFYVCVEDLEDELISAIGAQSIAQVITQQGDGADFQLLQQQPDYQHASLDDQVRAFVARRKIKYAPLLVDALDLANVPAPLAGVLQSV